MSPAYLDTKSVFNQSPLFHVMQVSWYHLFFQAGCWEERAAYGCCERVAQPGGMACLATDLTFPLQWDFPGSPWWLGHTSDSPKLCCPWGPGLPAFRADTEACELHSEDLAKHTGYLPTLVNRSFSWFLKVNVTHLSFLKYIPLKVHFIVIIFIRFAILILLWIVFFSFHAYAPSISDLQNSILCLPSFILSLSFRLR